MTKSKYTGLLICGDFNLPEIIWNSEGPTDIYESDTTSNSFVDMLADSFLERFVTKPTFQLDELTANNTLDLVIAECSERIDEISHYPPLTTLKKSHNVLKWSYKVQSTTQVDISKKKRLYHLADYDKMSEYFGALNWQLMFNGQSADQCYSLFLDYYKSACDLFMPVKKTNPKHTRCKWMNSELKHFLKSKNKLWFRCRASGYRNKELVTKYDKKKEGAQKCGTAGNNSVRVGISNEVKI